VPPAAQPPDGSNPRETFGKHLSPSFAISAGHKRHRFTTPRDCLLLKSRPPNDEPVEACLGENFALLSVVRRHPLDSDSNPMTVGGSAWVEIEVRAPPSFRIRRTTGSRCAERSRCTEWRDYGPSGFAARSRGFCSTDCRGPCCARRTAWCATAWRPSTTSTRWSAAGLGGGGVSSVRSRPPTSTPAVAPNRMRRRWSQRMSEWASSGGQHDPWTPDLVAEVTAQRRALRPLDEWEERVRWRDQQLIRLRNVTA
jgi:hypothetical protein